MTRQARLHFTLVGRSDNGHKVKDIEWTNEEQLETVKGIVSEYFGNRAVYVRNENSVKLGLGGYPEFYSAGWFFSETGVDGSDRPSELVVIAHGKSMESAKIAMLDAVKSVDWEEHAVNIS